jgi:hypothetical protein
MDIEGVGQAHPLKRATEEFRVELNREKMYSIFEENRKLFRLSVAANEDVQTAEKLYFNRGNMEVQHQHHEAQVSYDMHQIRNLCSQLQTIWEQDHSIKNLESILTRIRIWVGQDERVPTHVLFQEGIMQKIIDCLSQGFDNCLLIQNEALWILVNVLGGCDPDTTDKLVQYGLPESLLRMFHQVKDMKHHQIGENLLWCFCNLLQSQKKLSQYFLSEGILDIFLLLAESLPEKSESSYNITSTLIWAVYTVSSCIEYKLPLLSQKVCMIVQILITRNNYNTDQRALIKILQAFSEDKMVSMDLFSDELSQRLVQEMFNPDQTLAIPAANAICNCLSHEDVPEIHFLKAGLLNMIIKLYQHQRLREYRTLRRYTTLMLRNLLNSTREVFKLATRPDILRMCIELLKEEQDSTVMQNLLEYFRFYYLVGDNSLLLDFTFANPYVIQIIMNVTGLQKSGMINITCLIIINKILGLGDLAGTEEFKDRILETDSSEQLERLQEHQDKIVYNFAAKIIEKYFSGNVLQQDQQN